MSAPPFSEEAMALKFVKDHSSILRYVAKWSKWFLWDDKRWCIDDTREVFSMARELCREASTMSNKKGGSIASAKFRAAVISLVSDDQRIAARVDQWDRDPWLLNTPGGTVELRTGVMREHRPEDYMTKMTAVAPDAQCPTPQWNAYLDKVTGGDREYQKFLMRTYGYSLTGLTIEHAMFFLFGKGNNGKSTLLSTVRGIMADYHKTAPMAVFTDAPFERHPTELAMLQGARVVTAVETEEGRTWAEAKIKELTGGDEVSARFMRQDFFEFVPQFKLHIAGNNKPKLKSTDVAIRRRMNLLPFTVVIPKEEQDKDFVKKLEPEWPGILAQMIQGCLDWQRVGLAQPKVVLDSTEEYFEEEDAISQWLEEDCVEDPNEETPVMDLFPRWAAWAEQHGEKPGTSRDLSLKLSKTLEKGRMGKGGKVSFKGLGLKKLDAHDGRPEDPFSKFADRVSIRSRR